MLSSISQTAIAATDEFNLELPDDPVVIDLVDRVLESRDKAAFGELYDLFLTRIFRYLYYRTGSRIDAEDLTDQVFLHAWAGFGRFRWNGRPFQAWLYRIAHNVLVDHCRRSRPTISLHETFQTASDTTEHQQNDLERWLDAAVLSGAIQELPRDQQHVIALRFLESRDTKEVAQLMSVSESAVKKMQFKALQTLRKALERNGEDCEW